MLVHVCMYMFVCTCVRMYVCVYVCMYHACSGRNKSQKLIGQFFKMEYFVWLTKMDFGWPNVEIGQKMVNDQLSFLVLCVHAWMHTCTYVRRYVYNIVFTIVGMTF